MRARLPCVCAYATRIFGNIGTFILDLIGYSSPRTLRSRHCSKREGLLTVLARCLKVQQSRKYSC